MKKVIGILAIVAFTAVNLTLLTDDLSSSSVGLNSVIMSAHADIEVDKPCFAPAGSCSGWETWAHN